MLNDVSTTCTVTVICKNITLSGYKNVIGFPDMISLLFVSADHVQSMVIKGNSTSRE